MKSVVRLRRAGWGRWGTLLGAALIGFFAIVGGTAAALPPKALFVDVPNQDAADGNGHRPTDKKRRRVKVEFAALVAEAHPEGAPSVALNLFPDADHTAVKSRFERRDKGGYTWFGTVPGDPLSAVVLTTGGGLMRGLVFANGRHFEIRGASPAAQEVVEIDQSAFPPEGCDQIPAGEQTPMDTPPSSAQDPTSDTGATIDVLVVYTTAAMMAEGGAAAIELLAQNSVDTTNSSYANSGVAPRLRLAHAAEVTDAESADNGSGWDQDLAWLVGAGDGHLDAVHTLRETSRADVVVMLVNNDYLCGLAGAIMADASSAFSLVARSCSASNYSFGHEIGHLQGARHDMYADSTLGPLYDYNHGHVNLAIRRRTVMAYNEKCAVTYPYTYCERVPYWSNPAVMYPASSAPTGTATRENNALVLNNTASMVANFVLATSLTVASTYPASGVAITVDPVDLDSRGSGTTTFTRRYAPNELVTLTAPSPNGDGNDFAAWTGCDATSGDLGEICSVTMSSDKALVATYTKLTPTSFTLWSNSGAGQAAVLEIDTETKALQNYLWLYSPQGIGAPWKATSYTRVNATTAYVLWTLGETGRASLWKIDPSAATGYPPVVQVASGAHLYSATGVGAPWQATSFKYMSSGEGYVLWTRSDVGKAALWKINPGALDPPGVGPPIPIDSAAPLYSTAGIGSGWQATSFEYVSPGVGYVLWTRSDVGKAALWQINPGPLATPGTSPPIPVDSAAVLYSRSGVGAPWQATGFEYVSPTEAYVLWANSSIGRAAFWQISLSGMGGTVPIPVDSSWIADFPAELGSSFEVGSYAR